VAEKDALIRGYAQALLEIGEAEGELTAVEDELFAFAKALEGQTEVREALTDPALPAENKKALVRDLLGGRANPQTLNVLGFLIDQARTRELGRIIQALAELVAERRAHRLAEVRSAVPLDQGQRERLSEALSRATGHTVDVKVIVDPSVIGGIVARVGDEVFDGTVRGRLMGARERLAGA
jgi:F-type H+-transporting ATPase subunit delta